MPLRLKRSLKNKVVSKLKYYIRQRFKTLTLGQFLTSPDSWSHGELQQQSNIFTCYMAIQFKLSTLYNRHVDNYLHNYFIILWLRIFERIKICDLYCLSCNWLIHKPFIAQFGLTIYLRSCATAVNVWAIILD